MNLHKVSSRSPETGLLGPVALRVPFASGYAAFPPGSSLVLLARRTSRTARAALALYEAVMPRQRALLAAADLIVRIGGPRVMPRSHVAADAVHFDWWRSWIEAVAVPLVGPVADVALRVPPNGRCAALLLAGNGEPVGFAKLVPGPTTELRQDVDHLLRDGLDACRTPRLLDAGCFAEVAYRLHVPLPMGAHYPLHPSSDRIEPVIDAFQRRLAQVPRPAGTPATHVVCHADFTPRNLRRTSDGSVRLFDWDNARWGPRLADELHYWCAERAWRTGRTRREDAKQVLARLRARGSDAEIAEAAEWPEAPARTYRMEKQRLRRAVGRLVGAHVQAV